MVGSPHPARAEEPLLAGFHEAVQSDPLTTLDAMQRVAASAPVGPILVNAAPGTGKSYLLVRRVAYMVTELGVPAYQCAVFAADEERASGLREALDDLLGDEGREIKVSVPGGTVDAAHVFLDDLPLMPREFFTRLASGREADASVMATGDPDSFLGADGDWAAFDEFAERFPQSHTVRLSRNHRSPASVLTAMSQLVEPITRVPGRLVQPQRAVSEGCRIGRYFAEDERAEEEFAAGVVEELASRGLGEDEVRVVSSPEEVDSLGPAEPHTVLLTGFTAAAWPADDLSRRRFYVALSRARGSVFISHSDRGSHLLDQIDTGLFVPFGFVPRSQSSLEQPRLL